MNPSYRNEDAVVLASGGQDSTTCLFWALKTFRRVHAIGFFYHQKHAVELDAARALCASVGVDFKQIDLGFLKDLVPSQLFQGSGEMEGSHTLNAAVPSTFVPYRNLLFLTTAAVWASSLGARHLVTGVCETDYSGYADCRDVFVKATQVALNLATDFDDRNVVIHTPLMWLTKAEEFRMAEELGCLDRILRETVTCYNGDTTRHDYGMGCGACPACRLRKKGWDEFQAQRSRDGR